MKNLEGMSLQELAAYISNHLQQQKIPVVLVGGGCVSIYTQNQYQTQDIDFVEQYETRRSKLKSALEMIGFQEQARYFIHPTARYFLEFPKGPLAIGNQPIKQLHTIRTAQGELVLLTATDCIKEREFYNFRNLAGLFLHFLRCENSYIACYAPVFTP
ncbi:DUF6036 family nucleotidyltransferase [Candidatus Venteria ishoeyi]|uniref:HTH merR-type domain-containing protein n=1 Tax=Candidatus Venteria ishoeyi TaxID=1899563 RepID=A0A1H6F2X4_9GAMM|nr:DUF6036 family nucleotidyltransferase [Candidatus Venteria ishoeyi]SEH04507.1 Uncharacterised protein [Candidatus Venteria ishoeyi]